MAATLPEMHAISLHAIKCIEFEKFWFCKLFLERKSRSYRVFVEK